MARPGEVLTPPSRPSPGLLLTGPLLTLTLLGPLDPSMRAPAPRLRTLSSQAGTRSPRRSSFVRAQALTAHHLFPGPAAGGPLTPLCAPLRPGCTPSLLRHRRASFVRAQRPGCALLFSGRPPESTARIHCGRPAPWLRTALLRPASGVHGAHPLCAPSALAAHCSSQAGPRGPRRASFVRAQRPGCVPRCQAQRWGPRRASFVRAQRPGCALLFSGRPPESKARILCARPAPWLRTALLRPASGVHGAHPLCAPSALAAHCSSQAVPRGPPRASFVRAQRPGCVPRCQAQRWGPRRASFVSAQRPGCALLFLGRPPESKARILLRAQRPGCTLLFSGRPPGSTACILCARPAPWLCTPSRHSAGVHGAHPLCAPSALAAHCSSQAGPRGPRRASFVRAQRLLPSPAHAVRRGPNLLERLKLEASDDRTKERPGDSGRTADPARTDSPCQRGAAVTAPGPECQFTSARRPQITTF
ncbi:hypothetical protein NDU88_007110 [Pleurodeles waltl]|uniref:Uncharacterized protein n=1 Tax=Pleurodeles waltl TaxID=8319 RepID=A0AAV7MF16_PLEWA|nr:hypothetical protein NDU88_007110 [Pleurodeles waltl]